MIIETNFNIGDKVFFLFNNRIECEKITAINISNSIIQNLNLINYYVDMYDSEGEVFKVKLQENEIFKSLDELIKFLRRDFDSRMEKA